MSNWEEVRLSEISIMIKRGISPKYIEDGGLPIINQKCIRNNVVSLEFSRRCSNEKIIAEEKLIKVGDVLVNSTGAGTLGRTGWIKELTEPTTVDSHVTIVRPNQILVSDKFIALYLSLKENEIESMGKGATNQTELSASILGTLKINLPPLETQKRIASILSNYDDLIENNLKRIKLLEETAQNIYKEWFVNFRFPNYEHTEFDTERGLPVGWEIKKADNVYDINIGKTPPRGETQWFSLTDGIKWVSIADMNKSRVFVINTNEKITKDGVDKFNMRKASVGSVLLSFKLTVGAVVIANEEVVTNEAIAHFNLFEDTILTTEYTYQFLKNFHYPSLGSTSSIGTSINSKIVKNMDIIIPNENLIKEFSKGVKNIFIQIENLINQNQKLKEARDILLPRLMNRTIEV
jgi:type I restriction enzyme S subunit